MGSEKGYVPSCGFKRALLLDKVPNAREEDASQHSTELKFNNGGTMNILLDEMEMEIITGSGQRLTWLVHTETGVFPSSEPLKSDRVICQYMIDQPHKDWFGLIRTAFVVRQALRDIINYKDPSYVLSELIKVCTMPKPSTHRKRVETGYYIRYERALDAAIELGYGHMNI